MFFEEDHEDFEITYVLNVEIAYIQLCSYFIGTVKNDDIKEILDLFGEGCVSLLKEYVGCRDMKYITEWSEIDKEYLPAIAKELDKVNLFDMTKARFKVTDARKGIRYSSIILSLPYRYNPKSINLLKLKKPNHYHALAWYTEKKIKPLKPMFENL